MDEHKGNELTTDEQVMNGESKGKELVTDERLKNDKASKKYKASTYDDDSVDDGASMNGEPEGKELATDEQLKNYKASVDSKSKGKEVVRDHLISNDEVLHVPTGREDLATDERVMNATALRVPARRRWSDTRSNLIRSFTLAQVKSQLNTLYRSQAGFRAFVEFIVELDTKIGRRRTPEQRRLWDLFMLLLVPCLFLPLTNRHLWTLFSLFTIFACLNLIIVEREASEVCESFFHIILMFFIFLVLPGPRHLILVMITFLGLYIRMQEETAETERLPKFKSLMEDMLRYHQLEILCRYGDYLAERLGILRQYINENNLDTEHELSELWTGTSAILKAEERQEPKPYHDLIRTAAEGLKWDLGLTIFIVHEYAKRNSLMHAELFDLVDGKDWVAIGQRCKEDIEKLQELYINSDPNSIIAINHWVQIIGQFRDRWVSQSEDSSPWEARLVIREATADGIDDRASLNKLAMLRNDATPAQRKKAVDDMKKENDVAERQRMKAQRQAIPLAVNRSLQAEVKRLKDLLKSHEASGEDFLAKLQDGVKTDELERKNKELKHKIVVAENRNKLLEQRARKKDVQREDDSEEDYSTFWDSPAEDEEDEDPAKDEEDEDPAEDEEDEDIGVSNEL